MHQLLTHTSGLLRYQGSMDGVATHFVFGFDDERVCIRLSKVTPTEVAVASRGPGAPRCQTQLSARLAHSQALVHIHRI